MKLRTELINEWVRKAEVDYNSAKVLLKAEDEVNESICYHAHQVMEKYFKTFLVCLNVLPEKIHSLNTLVKEIEKIEGLDNELKTLIRGMNAYGVEIKYPSSHVNVKHEDALVAFKKASRLREIMRLKIENKVKEIEKDISIK